MSESESNKNTSAAGTSIGSVIQIVFIILKLAKVMPFKNWHWWMVFLPMEIGGGIFVLVLCCYCGVATYVVLQEKKKLTTNDDYSAVLNERGSAERPSLIGRDSLVQTC